MKTIRRMLALLLCAVLIGSSAAAGNAAADAPAGAAAASVEAGDAAPAVPRLALETSQLSVTVGARKWIAAEALDFETPPAAVVWSSDRPEVASVDANGVVTGVAVGSARITAAAMDGETPVLAACEVSVTARHSFLHFLMQLDYRYSSLDDFYLSDNQSAWQRPFGFTRLYDTASQLIGYQYDFARVTFTYDRKDWLVELWKGQYALKKYGAEIGVYTKNAVGFGDTPFSFYSSASKADCLNMEMTLCRARPDGTMLREFTCDYGSYWWCAGFRLGRLRQAKPAAELQMISRITLKDAAMALAFAAGMRDCGFTQVGARDALTEDTFCVEGCDVWLNWRNLTESQSLFHFVGGLLPASAVNIK